MKYVNYNNEQFFIGHFQGHSIDKYRDVIDEISKNTFSKPDNLTIITLKSNLLENAYLINQLENNNIDYINPLKDINIDKWKMTIKLKYIEEALNNCNTEYALVLDSKDVVIYKDLINIVETFKEYNKKILFNASKNNFPNVELDKVENRDSLGEFKYLNAGCCIGYTESLKEFYHFVNSLKLLNPFKSEQYAVRIGFDNKQDIVGFDYNCKIFQTFCKTNMENIDDNTIKIF